MNPREALAQGCTTLEPPCPPNEPPNIWLVGQSGTVTTPTLSLSVNLSDDRGLTGFNSSGATFSVQYNSTLTQGYGEAWVTLSPNVPTRITVWVLDTDGIESRDSIDVTYVPPPPPPAQGAPIISAAAHNGSSRGGGIEGEATLSYSTPAYTSLDVARGVTLVYSSARAVPRGFVQLEASDNSGTDPAQMSLRLVRQTNGQPATLLSGGTEVFYQGGDGAFRLGAAFAADTMATSAYDYTARVKNWWGTDTLVSTATVRTLVVNDKASPFGWGWNLAGLQQLHFGRPDSAIVVTGGDGSIAFFANPGCSPGANCTYTSPSGDFTVLKFEAASGKFTRRTLHGTVFTFFGSGPDRGRLEKVVDRFNNATTFSYVSGRVEQITDPAGKVIVLEYGVQGIYGAAGKLAKIRDPGGRESKFAYDAAGNLIKIVDPDGVIALEAIYDASHRVMASWGRTGARTDLTYDAHGTVDSVKAPEVLTSDAGLTRPVSTARSLMRAVLPAAGKGSSAVPADLVRPDSVYVRTVAPNGSATRVWLHASGATLKVIERDPSGTDVVTTWIRNADGLPTQVTSPRNAITTYGWSGALLVSMQEMSTGILTTYEYEPTYNQVQKIYLNDELKQTNFYGTAGRLDSVKVDTSISRFTYDSRGRLLMAKDPEGHEQRIAYLSTGFQNTDWIAVVRSGVERKTTYGYDGFGRRTSATDHTGRAFTTAFDSVNRVRSTTAPDTMNITYGYNDPARMYTVTDPKSQMYRDSLNALGWVVKRTDPRGLSDSFEYDRRGNMTRHTSRRGAIVRFTYDTLDRVKTRVGDAIGGAAKDSAAFFYDAQMKWVAVSNGESVDTLRLDSKDRPSEAVSRRGTERRYAVQSTYDDAGMPNLTRLAVASVTGYQSGQPIWIETKDSVMLGYDEALRQNLLARFPGGTYKGTSLTHTRDGLPKEVRLPTGASPSDNVRLKYVYAPSHRQDSLVLSRPDLHVTHGRAYTHDVLDRFASETHGYAWDKTVRRAEYTTLGRLKSFTDERVWEEIQQVCPDPLDPMSCYNQTVVHTDTLRREVFTYDKVGNRTDRGAVIQTGNRVTSVDGYTLAYDDDGNLTSKSKSGVWSQSFTWNALGQLVQVVTNGTTTTFGYDGWGRRVRKTVGTTRTDYVLDGDHIIAELDGAGGFLRSYAYYPGVDKPHSVKVGTQLYYYVTEQPGHVTGLVNAGNQLVNQYSYTAAGEAISAQEQVVQPLRFAGREYDSDAQLYFNRARYYDAHLGRFISEDPIGLVGGMNLFAYGDNDPMSVRDPFGLDADREVLQCPTGWEVAEIGIEPDGTPYIDCVPKRSGTGRVNFNFPHTQGGCPLGMPGNECDTFNGAVYKLIGLVFKISLGTWTCIDAGTRARSDLAQGALWFTELRARNPGENARYIPESGNIWFDIAFLTMPDRERLPGTVAHEMSHKYVLDGVGFKVPGDPDPLHARAYRVGSECMAAIRGW
jgi:RHS repeat-associated protein